jgi:hypothetical protein
VHACNRPLHHTTAITHQIYSCCRGRTLARLVLESSSGTSNTAACCAAPALSAWCWRKGLAHADRLQKLQHIYSNKSLFVLATTAQQQIAQRIGLSLGIEGPSWSTLTQRSTQCQAPAFACSSSTLLFWQSRTYPTTNANRHYSLRAGDATYLQKIARDHLKRYTYSITAATNAAHPSFAGTLRACNWQLWIIHLGTPTHRTGTGISQLLLLA